MRVLLTIVLFLVACEQKVDTSLLESEISENRKQILDLRLEIAGLEKKLDLLSVKQLPAKNIRLEEKPDYRDDVLFGNIESAVGIMAFVDYTSEPTRSFLQDVLPALRSREDVFVVLRDYPLAKNSGSIQKAQELNCAGEQGQFLEYLAGDLSALDTEKHSFCVKSGRYKREIAKDIEEARLLGVKSVPTFLLFKSSEDISGGLLVRGNKPLVYFTETIKNFLDD